MPKWAAARTIAVASYASETIRTAHSRLHVPRTAALLFRQAAPAFSENTA